MIIVNRIPQNEGKGVHFIMYKLVPDPDLEIGGGGGGREVGGEGRTQEHFFPALRALKIRGAGGEGGGGPALDPPL